MLLVILLTSQAPYTRHHPGGISKCNSHFEKNWVREITWLSWRHHFRKTHFWKCFLSIRKQKPGVFKFLPFEERFCEGLVWTASLPVGIKLRFRDGLVWTIDLPLGIKLRFRDGLVWTAGLPVGIKLRFQIFPTYCEQGLSLTSLCCCGRWKGLHGENRLGLNNYGFNVSADAMLVYMITSNNRKSYNKPLEKEFKQWQWQCRGQHLGNKYIQILAKSQSLKEWPWKPGLDFAFSRLDLFNTQAPRLVFAWVGSFSLKTDFSC